MKGIVTVFFFVASILFVWGANELPAKEVDGWKEVRNCHNTLRAKLKSCDGKKCISKAFKEFEQCAQKETKGAKLRKGSSYKKLAKSIQQVVDAVQPHYNNCYVKAKAFEEKELKAAGGAKKASKTDKTRVQKETEKVRNECFKTLTSMSNKAMEAQIKQHFE